MSYKVSVSQISTCISEAQSIEFFDIHFIDHIEFLSKSNHNLYRCHDNRYNKNFAIKIYPIEEFLCSSSYTNEIRFADLCHPNVIEIREYQDQALANLGESIKPVSYILMELGKTDLGEFMKKRNFSSDEILARTFFQQLVEGVKYLHSKEIFHMDLKPGNLLLGEDLQLKIIDFDLAITSRSETPLGKGSRNFRAPEVIRETVTDPAKSDIFSMGIILYFLLTGEVPYQESDPDSCQYFLPRLGETFYEKMERQMGWKTTLSPAFRKLFQSMTYEAQENRCTIADIEANEWYNGPVYSREQIAECIKNRK